MITSSSFRASARQCSKCFEAEGVVLIWGATRWCRPCVEARNDMVGRRALLRHDLGGDPANFTPAILRQIAESGIMDAASLFVPAGKLSMADTRAREAGQVEVA